jgi:hypothetical protein
MDESNYAIHAIHAHIRNPEDYKISNCSQHENSILIKTEQGNVILTIDGDVALMMAMDLTKAVVARMKQDVNKEIETLSIFES